MILENLRCKVLETAKQMLTDGVVNGSQGNVSARDSETGWIVITPSAIPYLQLSPEDICVLDACGEIIEAAWKPTTESRLHLTVYRNRADVQAVIHTHPLFSSVFGIVDLPLEPVLTEAAMSIGGPIPVAPYGRPGSQELADQTAEKLGNGTSVLMANHGLVTVGTRLEEAYTTTLAVESCAKVSILALAIGQTPHALSFDEVKIIRENFLSKYHPTKLPPPV